MIVARPVQNFHIIISGFRQRRWQDNGSFQLWYALREVSSPTSCVQMATWKDDFKELADRIAAVSVPCPTIKIYAYSWGAGWGFIQLCKELERHSFQVVVVVLCDPVYRSPYLPTWLPLNPLSMVWLPVITIPEIVLEVHSFHQTIDRPRAHRLVKPLGSGTIINRSIELTVPHRQMDKTPEYLMTSLEIARG